MPEVRQEAADQLARLVDRLRQLTLTRLEAAYQPEPTRVVAARRLTQQVADLCAVLECPGAPTWREVPEVGAGAAGDLLAVCANDLLAAASGVPDAAQLTLRHGGTVSVRDALATVAAAALELRRRL